MFFITSLQTNTLVVSVLDANVNNPEMHRKKSKVYIYIYGLLTIGGPTMEETRNISSRMYVCMYV